jgi:hypothetical protein
MGAWLSSLWNQRRLDLRIKGLSPSPGGASAPNSVRPIRLLLEAGILTAPAVPRFWPAPLPWFVQALTIPAWHAVLRYGDVFAAGTTDFALRDAISHLPSRQKQLLSEELAIGYCGYVLREVFQVQHIADAEPLLGGQLHRVNQRDKRCPDYFCRRPDGTVVIAEAKGALGDMRTLAPRLRKGKRQVGAVTPAGTSVHARVVTGLGLSLKYDARPSTAAIYDPQDEQPMSVEISADALVRHAYAKVFVFLGLLGHARQVAPVPTQAPPESAEDIGIERERSLLRSETVREVRIMVLEFPPIPEAELAIGVAESVYQALTRETQGLLEPVSSALAEIVPREDDVLIVLNNGLALIRR